MLLEGKERLRGGSKVMKSIGVVRKLDPLGRICLPRELRKCLTIEESDPLEIFTEGENIILRKYNPGCHNCNSLENLHKVGNIVLCKECAKEFAKAVK